MGLQSEKINEIAAALAKAQQNIGRALKDSDNPFFNSKYADLGSVMDACMSALNAEGIAVSQSVAQDGDRPVLVTCLLHSSGQYLESRCPLYSDSKSRNAMHALGSAITYARRYGLAAICGVCQEDDDGNKSAVPVAQAKAKVDDTITQDESAYLKMLLESDNEYRTFVMNFMRKGFDVEEVEQMPRVLFDKILPMAEKKHMQAQANQKEAS